MKNLTEKHIKETEEDKESSDREEEESEDEEDEEDIIDLDQVTAGNADQKPYYDKDNINIKNLDIEIMPKEDIVNFLLSDKLTASAYSKKDTSSNILGTSTMKKNSKYLIREKPLRVKNYFMHTNDNPEMINDFDSAYSRVVEKMNRDNATTDSNDLYRILLFNNEEETKKLDPIPRKEIAKKVEFYLTKKTQNLENIQDKIKEEFDKSYTFKPQTNVDKQNHRKFKEFIYDQKEHIKKVKEKVGLIKEEVESAQVKNTAPVIDEKSAKIFAKKIKKEKEPVYMRLYNKMKKKDKAKKKKKGKPKNLDEKSRLKQLYMEVFKRKSKLDEIGKKLIEEELKDQTATHLLSNKILLKKFIKIFNREIEKLKNICLDDNSKSNPNQESANKENSEVESKSKDLPKQVPENKITIDQLNSFLQSINFITKEKQYTKEEEKMLSLNESVLKQKEKRLVQDIIDNLKETEDLIDKENLYYFLLAVLNLYETCILKLHKLDNLQTEENKTTEQTSKQEQDQNNGPQEKRAEDEKSENKPDDPKLKHDKKNSKDNKEIKNEKKKKKPSAEDKEKEKAEIKKKLLEKLNEEIVKKVKSTRKYASFDENFKIIIPLALAEQINNHFNLLYINYSSNVFLNQKESNKESKTRLKGTMVFKPKIDPNSEKLSINFRKKIKNEFEHEIPEKNKIPYTGKNSHLNNQSYPNNGHDNIYIESLLIKRRKQEKSMAKLKEEYEYKELESCSFKPKIRYYFNNQAESKEARYETLYKLGTSQEKKRKDKTKKQFDEETFNKDTCTFKPQVEKYEKQPPDTKFYKQQEVSEFKERLEIGREEKKLKESAYLRYDFKDPYEVHKQKLEKRGKSKKERKSKFAKSLSTLESLKERTMTSIDEVNDPPPAEKGDQIPLLIIDVNIKPGMKKKIYVFDGDTADALANKFAKEHKLDSETKYKLKILIENHMSKLLMRIEEENQSISSEV